MQRAIKIVQEKNLVCEDRGALLVDLEKYKLEKAIVRKGGECQDHFAQCATDRC